MNLIRIDNICLPVNKFYLQEFTNYDEKKKKTSIENETSPL